MYSCKPLYSKHYSHAHAHAHARKQVSHGITMQLFSPLVAVDGGYCNQPGECLCREGYEGMLCDMTPSAAAVPVAAIAGGVIAGIVAISIIIVIIIAIAVMFTVLRRKTKGGNYLFVMIANKNCIYIYTVVDSQNTSHWYSYQQ